MQITISVGGRFHAFYLARQLFKRGSLKRLITSYPKFEVKKYGIPPNLVRSLVLMKVLERLWEKVPSIVKNSYNPQFALAELFDKRACRYIDNPDIFVGWSGFSLHALRKAKERGALVIVERGSSHISYQQEILREEYGIFGLKFKGAHPKIVEKELREYEEADYIEVPSTFAKKTFLEQGIKEEKIIQGFRGVSLQEFGRKTPKIDGVFRIIYVGGMSLRKGVHYLLQAFSELNLPNTQLWLIGRMSDEIEPFLKKYGNERVSCKGPYPQGELYKYYSQGSVFVLMSIEEGFANVIVQAMACGLPVICTNNTGGEDIVREGLDGYLIPIRSVTLLKELLKRLYENPGLLRDLSENAQRRVTPGFTWDDYGEQIIGKYKEILNKGG
jgi:glycosyltransferase involved in cell wall biosynthesis